MDARSPLDTPANGQAFRAVGDITEATRIAAAHFAAVKNAEAVESFIKAQAAASKAHANRVYSIKRAHRARVAIALAAGAAMLIIGAAVLTWRALA